LTILYFDCFSGAAGDMILGALLDAGLPLDELRRALGSLAIDPSTVWTERVTRAGVSATKFHVRGEVLAIDHAHDHERGLDDGGAHHHTAAPAHQDEEVRHHHAHRSIPEINALIERSALSGSGKDRAKHLFAVRQAR
jgi:uncharacterized protein (DUF111 family)